MAKVEEPQRMTRAGFPVRTLGFVVSPSSHVFSGYLRRHR